MSKQKQTEDERIQSARKSLRKNLLRAKAFAALQKVTSDAVEKGQAREERASAETRGLNALLRSGDGDVTTLLSLALKAKQGK